MQWIVAASHSLDSSAQVGTTHLVRYLAARGHRVLYLPAPVSPVHYAMRRRDARFRERRPYAGRRPRRAEPGVLQYTPSTLLPALGRFPFDTSWALRHSLSATRPNLRRVIEEAGFSHPDVLVVANLQYAWLDNLCQPGRLVYRCVDDILGFQAAPASLLGAECALLRRADATIATSGVLARRLVARGATTVDVIPNGVALAHFAEAAGRSREENEADAPADLKAIARPRVVYCGTVNERFDCQWVRATAQRLPGVQFAILGPWERDDAALRNIENVHILGPVRPDRVPRYLAACEAAMIPFRPSALVDATCPIKLFEYLALGLPVVATRWAELERLAPPVALVDNAEAFCDGIGRAIDAPGSRSERLAWAGRCDWQKRFDAMISVVEAARANRKRGEEHRDERK